MPFNSLKHWWYIYAPFQAVTQALQDTTYLHPHQGQVIHYMRRLRQKTQEELAQGIQMSPTYIGNIELRPDGTRNIERSIDLITYLQIPPRLLSVPEDIFVPDTDGTRAALWKKIAALSETSDTTGDEAVRLLKEHQRSCEPNYLPLSIQERKKYELAVYEGPAQFMRALDIDSWLANLSKNKLEETCTSDELCEAEQGCPPYQVHTQHIRGGILAVESGLEQTTQAMKHATGYRLDQLVYVQYALYESVLHPAILKSEIIAELGAEKKLEYATKWLTCAQFLGNVVLEAKALAERAHIYLERQQQELARADLRRLESCLAIMYHPLGCFKYAATVINSLDRCLELTKGNMRHSLDCYQIRARKIIKQGLKKRKKAKWTRYNAS
jgi:transcriptional regulator with XRE-family HTH domain